MTMNGLCAALWTVGATVQWVTYSKGHHNWLLVAIIYTAVALLYLSGWVSDLRKR